METITFDFYNSFTGESLGGRTMPYDRMKAKDGYYTRIWRKFKPGLADIFRLDKHWVRVRISKGQQPLGIWLGLPR